ILFKQVRKIFTSLIHLVRDEVAAEKSCRIFGLGTFQTIKSKKRIGRNPKTGDAIKIPQKIKIRFRPGKELRTGMQTATKTLKLNELASLMVSELLLYNSRTIDEGIRNNDLAERLEKQLIDARENFKKRIPANIANGMDIFENTWSYFIRKRERAIAAMN
ncbi:HU family DNA-binding protein, partial [bacterium]|nr:HU family DNA-binding protein [bacterium]